MGVRRFRTHIRGDRINTYPHAFRAFGDPARAIIITAGHVWILPVSNVKLLLLNENNSGSPDSLSERRWPFNRGYWVGLS